MLQIIQILNFDKILSKSVDLCLKSDIIVDEL